MASRWGPWEMWNTGKKHTQVWYEKSQELGFLARPEAAEKESNFAWPCLFPLGLHCGCSFKDASTKFQFFGFNKSISMGLFQEKRSCYGVG